MKTKTIDKLIALRKYIKEVGSYDDLRGFAFLHLHGDFFASIYDEPCCASTYIYEVNKDEIKLVKELF